MGRIIMVHSMLKISLRPVLQSMAFICCTSLKKATLLHLAIRFRYCSSSFLRFSTNQGFKFPNHFFLGRPIPPSFSSKAYSIEQRVRKQYYLTTFFFKTLKFSFKTTVYSTQSPMACYLMAKVQSGMSLGVDLWNSSVSNVLFYDFLSMREGFFRQRKPRIIEPVKFSNWESYTQGQSIWLTERGKKVKTALVQNNLY